VFFENLKEKLRLNQRVRWAFVYRIRKFGGIVSIKQAKSLKQEGRGRRKTVRKRKSLTAKWQKVRSIKWRRRC
jgi:hypothetical protein